MIEAATRMADELREAPRAVMDQASALAVPLSDLVTRLKSRPPQFVVTCARGSSAHAATFGKHLIERHLGVPVAAMAPNIATVYRRWLRLSGQLFLAISQSGRSDDLVESATMAKAAGALTAALVNVTDSPLAAACDIVLPMEAGPERSVAATKTFIASLAALLRLVALWSDEEGALSTALDRLPDRLGRATELDWDAAARAVAAAPRPVAIGPGPTPAGAPGGGPELEGDGDPHARSLS